MAKSLGIDLPLVLDVVEEEHMIETMKSGKYLIIAIPVEDVHLSGESTNES